MSSNNYSGGSLKVGVYIDLANLSMNGGFGARYGALREFACRDNAEPVRLNVYVSFDPSQADADREYRARQFGFHSTLRDLGYKVIIKDVRWFTDDQGNRIPKANVDLDLAVDALLQSERIDRVVLATGDGDFIQVVRALQNRGCRVEVVAFEHVSGDLRREADLFMSGYLIPNFLPIKRDGNKMWGSIGSFVRGCCYHHDPVKPFGFIRYLRSLDGKLWDTDTRRDESPYTTIFFHDSELPKNLDPLRLPSRDIILEFRVVENPRDPGKFSAAEIEWVNPGQ